MNVSLFKSLVAAKDQKLERLKKYLDQRTPRQRLYIVLIAFLLFAAVDIWMMVHSLSAPSRPQRMEHIETIITP